MKSGKSILFPFISARGIQERLDGVFGVDNWSTEYTIVDKGVICRLTCTFENGKTVSKEDGANFTDIEPLKGGLSGAFKRVASSGYGIGRYLYDIPPVIVTLEGNSFKGKVILPDQFLPEQERTGNDKLKIEYDNEPIEMTYEEAKEVVITKDAYNAGKKLSEVSEKNLSFIASRGATARERQGAKILLEHK